MASGTVSRNPATSRPSARMSSMPSCVSRIKRGGACRRGPQGRPWRLDPQPVDVQVQDAEAALLDEFLGAQKDLASIRRHRLVRLDPSEAGVLVAQVAEAGDQQPLVGRIAPAVDLLARIVLGQLADERLVMEALLQQRC